MSSESIGLVARGIRDQTRGEVEEALRALEVRGEEARAIVDHLILVSAEVSVAKLAGLDTSIAEASMVATYKNLESATTTEVAQTTAKIVQSTILAAVRGVFMLLTAL